MVHNNNFSSLDFQGLNSCFSPHFFLLQTYDDLERKYWKTLSFCPPIYGCDVSDSITDREQKSWNIRDLGTILNLVNESYDQEIKGVNSPYLYFGMWKATFRYNIQNLSSKVQSPLVMKH